MNQTKIKRSSYYIHIHVFAKVNNPKIKNVGLRGTYRYP